MKTALEIAEALDEAGHTLRRLSASGGFPAGHKSNWPETMRELGLIEMVDLKTEVRKSPPTAKAISNFDKLHAIIAASTLTPDERRLLWWRAGCIPGHRRSWKHIARHFGMCVRTAQRHYLAHCIQLAEISRKRVSHNRMSQFSGIAA